MFKRLSLNFTDCQSKRDFDRKAKNITAVLILGFGVCSGKPDVDKLFRNSSGQTWSPYLTFVVYRVYTAVSRGNFAFKYSRSDDLFQFVHLLLD
jgi:hypothetical protein